MDLIDRSHRRLQIILSPLREGIFRYLVPVTDSTEFRSLYPLIVISLGVLAAVHADSWRTFFSTILLFLIVVASSVVIFLDTRKIRLELRWNLLFFSYYRPFLIKLSNLIARDLQRRNKVDLVTYRTGDLFSALDEAGADFEQVSGDRVVNIASFDIEYIPALRKGVRVGELNYRLIPLSDFWPDDTCYDFQEQIPRAVRVPLLQRIDAAKMYCLPIGWGLVGVAVIERDLSGVDIIDLVTTEMDGKIGVSFAKLVSSLETIQARGYEVLCYDLWSTMVQMVSLNYTGHMTISTEDSEVVRNGLSEIYRALPPKNIISDPVLLLSQVRDLERVVVIGGATWFGMKGALLPIATPEASPTYGGFCECFGLLAAPKHQREEQWERDASRLTRWLADNLCDQTVTWKAPERTRSILSNFLPGLEKAGRTRGLRRRAGEIDVWVDQPMQIDEDAEIIFRQFGSNGADPAAEWREIWLQSKPLGAGFSG